MGMYIYILFYAMMAFYSDDPLLVVENILHEETFLSWVTTCVCGELYHGRNTQLRHLLQYSD
jgi:hypothetical protein